MKILIGSGNAVTTSLNTTDKTLAFSGAYNFDIVSGGLSIYNTTRSAYMWGGTTPPSTTISGAVITSSAGLPVQTFTFNELPASTANGDVLVILLDCPDDVAIYNATIFT